MSSLAGPLTVTQVEDFEAQGYVLLEGALGSGALAALNAQLLAWTRESAAHAASYGAQLDGRPRFGGEPGHCAQRPALRRVASPLELSVPYLEVMRDSRAVDAVAQLLGPAIRFNNAKINSKHPGTATAVKFHQDFLFGPRSNDDMVTVLYFLDEVTLDNGPLEVVPGSHRGPLYEHWQDGVFTGAVDRSVAAMAQQQARPCTGAAGTACLMHTRLLHGSALNRSTRPRTLYIVEYSAEDSYPLQCNHIPSVYEGELVRGEASNKVRCSSYEMSFPEVPTGASFFEQQVKQEVAGP